MYTNVTLSHLHGAFFVGVLCTPWNRSVGVLWLGCALLCSEGISWGRGSDVQSVVRYCFFYRDDMMKAAREQSGTWWAPSAAQVKKEGSTAGAPSAGRRVRPRKPSRLSRQRSAQPEVVHVHPCCGLKPERLSPDPPTQSGTKCSPQERQGSPAELWLVEHRQAGQQHWRHKSVTEQKQRIAVGVVLVVIGRGVITAGEHGEPNAPHRTLGVGYACDACPVCVAVPQRRQRGDLDQPAGRRTHWDQQQRREVRTERRRWAHQPRSEARYGQRQRPESWSGGGWRQSGREEPRSTS